MSATELVTLLGRVLSDLARDLTRSYSQIERHRDRLRRLAEGPR